jgi:carboxymethylenebutenolidase
MESSPATESVTYPSSGRQVTADVARPVGAPPWPAVILIHELSGVSDHYRDIAARFASEGYLALVPDLYANDAVFKSLSEHSVHAVGRVRHAHDLDAAIAALNLPPHEQEELRRAAHWDRERDTSTYVPDLQAAIHYLRSRSDVRDGAVAAIGYCWGGGILGQLLVAGGDLAAAEIYYGEPPALDRVGAIRCPVEGHYGTGDTVVGYKFAPDLDAAMKSQSKDFAYYLYVDAPHAFFNDTGPRYRPEAAKLAWERTLAFFERHLKGATIVAS